MLWRTFTMLVQNTTQYTNRAQVSFTFFHFTFSPSTCGSHCTRICSFCRVTLATFYHGRQMQLITVTLVLDPCETELPIVIQNLNVMNLIKNQ